MQEVLSIYRQSQTKDTARQSCSRLCSGAEICCFQLAGLNLEIMRDMSYGELQKERCSHGGANMTAAEG